MSIFSFFKGGNLKAGEEVRQVPISGKPVLVVGLGNPGSKYNETRHNIGRDVVMNWVLREGLDFSLDKRSNAQVAKMMIEDREVECILPETFMNLSGDSVREYINFYKKDYLVVLVHDELDLPLGKVKISQSKNTGGHNGVASVFKNTNLPTVRVRLGVSPTEDGPEYLHKMRKYKSRDFVLAQFDDDEREDVKSSINKGVKAIELIVKKGVDKAMNEVNGS